MVPALRTTVGVYGLVQTHRFLFPVTMLKMLKKSLSHVIIILGAKGRPFLSLFFLSAAESPPASYVKLTRAF